MHVSSHLHCLSLAVFVLLPFSLNVFAIASIVCTNHTKTIISHSHTSLHCLCPAANPICKGSHCSTGHVHCGISTNLEDCHTVYGYDTDCDDCHCVPDTQEHLHAPQQVFASMTAVEGQMAINAVVPGRHDNVTVHYGATLKLNRIVAAQERIDHDYDRLHYTIWTAVIEAAPLSTVYYRVLNGGDGTMMHRLLMPSSSHHNATVGVCGDIGLGWSAPMVTEAIRQDTDLNMMIQPGDISYAFKIEDMNRYLDRVQSFASRMPYVTLLGNHEAENSAVLKAYLARFPNDIPARNSHSPSQRYYSYDSYGIHFVILDSMSDLSRNSLQIKWLIEDLKRAQARRIARPREYPWIIVSYHYPMYSSHNRNGDRAKPGQMKCLQTSLEDIFYEYQVDIALTGHDHVYERSFAMYKHQPQVSGIVHMTVGTGGHNVYEDWNPMPKYTAYRLAEPGYGKLHVLDDGSLSWEFYQVDISPCKRMTLGGDKNCPTRLVQQSHGDYKAKTILKDTVVFKPRRTLW